MSNKNTKSDWNFKIEESSVEVKNDGVKKEKHLTKKKGPKKRFGLKLDYNNIPERRTRGDYSEGEDEDRFIKSSQVSWFYEIVKKNIIFLIVLTLLLIYLFFIR